MDYFKRYVSNTLAGSGNQHFFLNEKPDQVTKSRTFYQVYSGGKFDYSFLFSNTIDSTYNDGSASHKNLMVDNWTIHSLKAGVSKRIDPQAMDEPCKMLQVTFDGKMKKQVNPGELFCSDSITLDASKGEYICVEIDFSGEMIPYHEESIISSFVLQNDQWVFDKCHPFVSMVGCNRKAHHVIGFLGDSITQGIGTALDSYLHWNSIVAENIGEKYAYWNLGLGYARADDAASDGVWLFKAKQCDTVVVCFGVNDIYQGFSETQIKKNLADIVDKLKGQGRQVILQTVPPFNYSGELIKIWQHVNQYILNELSDKVDMVFDCVQVLQQDADHPHNARYGGHPDQKGCKLLGDAFSEALIRELKL